MASYNDDYCKKKKYWDLQLVDYENDYIGDYEDYD